MCSISVNIVVIRQVHAIQMLGRALDPCTNANSIKHEVFILGQTIEEQERIVERLEEMRKGRRED